MGTRSLRDVATQFDYDGAGAYLYTDVPLNVALFVPFGFGLAGTLSARQRRQALLMAVLGGVVVSAGIETVQGYMLLRDPAMSDIVANGLGGALGVLVFGRAGDAVMLRLSRVSRRAESSANGRNAVTIYAGFLVVVVVGSMVASGKTDLSNWEPDFGLTVGNEVTGDRPWEGSIRSYQLLDRSLSDDDTRLLFADDMSRSGDVRVVASKDFTSERAGFPPLAWNSGKALVPAPGGVRLGADWLFASGDVAGVSRSLAGSGQFTLKVEVATDDLKQSGPARIVSISDGLIDRNLTLAQDGSSLIVRIRTPLTGHDAVPELSVPGVFVDDEMHDIVVRYDGAHVRVGLDGTPEIRSIEIGPEAAILLASYPIDIARLRLNPISNWMFRVIYRLVILAPWALLLTRAHRDRRSSREWSRSRVLAAVVAPSVVLEAALAAAISTYDFRAPHVLLNIVILGLLVWGLRHGGVPECRVEESAELAVDLDD